MRAGIASQALFQLTPRSASGYGFRRVRRLVDPRRLLGGV